jgi:hypothetical protein
MKIQKIVLASILFFSSVGMLSAQNSLPSASDDNCWSSFGALRACQIKAEEQAQDYARRCTSYPESSATIIISRSRRPQLDQAPRPMPRKRLPDQ